MSWGWATLNIAYLVYAASGLFKTMLPLRAMLLASTALFIVYGIVADIWSVFWWNLPVAVVHGWWVFKLVKQHRNVNLDDEAEAINTLLYPELGRVEFSTFWNTGAEREVAALTTLLQQGEPVEELILILDGNVQIIVDGEQVALLGPLRMVGEMSSVTGEGASATVVTYGGVRLRAWKKTAIDKLSEDYPAIGRAALQAIGRELTRKAR